METSNDLISPLRLSEILYNWLKIIFDFGWIHLGWILNDWNWFENDIWKWIIWRNWPSNWANSHGCFFLSAAICHFYCPFVIMLKLLWRPHLGQHLSGMPSIFHLYLFIYFFPLFLRNSPAFPFTVLSLFGPSRFYNLFSY